MDEKEKTFWDDLSAAYGLVREFLDDKLHIAPQYVDATAYTLVVLLAVYLLRRLLLFPLSRLFRTPAGRYLFQKIGTAALWIVAIIAIAVSWGMKAGNELFVTLALVFAGAGFALQEPASNLAGWFVILLSKPFELKDRVQIGDGLKGDVIDISVFNFALLEVGNWVDADQSTGRIVHIPNATVFRETIANYTQGFGYIWNEIAVMVTFESNWERAHEILTEIADTGSKDEQEKAAEEVRATSTRFMVYYTRFTPIVWVKVADSGVVLTMRYLCETRRRRSSESEIWRHILLAFAECDDIDFAYPTERRYNNKDEGKPRAGGPSGDVRPHHPPSGPVTEPGFRKVDPAVSLDRIGPPVESPSDD